MQARRASAFSTFLKRNMVVIFLVILCIGFGIGTSDVFTSGNVMDIFSSSIFFSANNLVNLTTQMAINAVLSAGLTYVIILGGIDISVGSVAALAGVVAMLVAQQLPNVNTFVAVLVLLGSAIAVGVVCGGFNGLMMPVLEDTTLAKSSAQGSFNLKDLLLFSAVCGTGLDTVPLPGDATPAQLTAVLLDVASLAVRLHKPLTARLMPIPGKKAGESTQFDFDYFVNGGILDLPAQPLSGPLAGNETYPIGSYPSYHP